jgi:hypothetical protein
MLSNKPGLERVLGCPIGLILLRCGVFLGDVIAQFVLIPKEKVKERKIGVTGGYPITVTST